MALAFGGGVRPELGRTDYSAIARGGEMYAQLAAQGSQMVGQGLAKALEGAGKAIVNYQERKETNKIFDSVLDDIIKADTDSGGALARQLKISDPTDKNLWSVGVLSLGSDKRTSALMGRQLLQQLSEQQAFTAGLEAVKNIPTFETVKEVNPEVLSFDSSLAGSFNASLLDKPENKLPKTSTPSSTFEVPQLLNNYYVYNAQQERLIPTVSLQRDTENTTLAFQQLEQEKETINNQLKQGGRENPSAARDLMQGVTGPGILYTESPTPVIPFTAEDVFAFNSRLDQINKEQEPFKSKLIELANVREAAELFGKNPTKTPKLEEKAEGVISRSIKLAKNLNLDPVEQNQWKQMGFVLREIPRNVSDEEKIATFVQAYSQKNPIDIDVYSKIRQLFNSTPIITDLGAGRQIVTVKNQSFVINSETKPPINVQDKKFESESDYANLVTAATQVGLGAFKLNHLSAYNQLIKLHVMHGGTNPLTGTPNSLEDTISSFSTQPPRNNDTDTRLPPPPGFTIRSQ